MGEADLDYPLAFDKVEPEPTTSDSTTSIRPICDQLRKLSQQRVQNSEKFQKVVRNIARYKEQKAKKYVTLNEAKFLKERSELNADKEEEKEIDKHAVQRAASNAITISTKPWPSPPTISTSSTWRRRNRQHRKRAEARDR